jgi:hypothetical protein
MFLGSTVKVAIAGACGFGAGGSVFGASAVGGGGGGGAGAFFLHPAAANNSTAANTPALSVLVFIRIL